MTKISSVYELSRDGFAYPTYWQSPGNTCLPHFHSSLELTYIREGEMEILLDGRELTAGTGELVIVPSYAVHRYNSPPETDTVVLIIPLDYIRSFRQRTAGLTFAEALVPRGPLSETVAHCLEMLLDRPDCSGESYVVRGQVYTILGALLEEIPLRPARHEPDHSRVREMLGYLHANFRQPLTLGHIAATFGYSPSRVSHIFNKNVGCSIPEYLNTLRSRAAAGLLREGTSITDAAMNAGFESMRTFYRAFKSCFGVTPSRYVELSPGDRRQLLQEYGIHDALEEQVPAARE